ncbi:MAG: AAA family ATPase, partial [Rhabdochlamydiaceae bacterium]
LHGIPGSGKTTYLRYLMGAIKDKRLIYVPPSMSEALAHPDLLQILLAHRNSVLLIEDAELVVGSRESREGNNQAVSNLLNMSDGILGDLLQIQIVCTFNTDISNIDTALLRPGRLIGEYHFGPLSGAKSNALVDELYGNGTYTKRFGDTIQKELTLADIYSLDEPRFIKEKKKKVFGFVQID